MITQQIYSIDFHKIQWKEPRKKPLDLMVIRITIHYDASVKVTVTWRQRHTPIGRIYVTGVYITVTILRHQRFWRRYVLY